MEEALAIARRLLDAGADPEPADASIPPPGLRAMCGSTPRRRALPHSTSPRVPGIVELVKMLAERGGNPNLVRKDGHTPFSVAVMAGNLAVVKEMVARGADLSSATIPPKRSRTR